MLTVCLSALLASAVPQVSPPTSQDKAFALEQSKLALELYRALDDLPGNLVLSPFSIARALALAREGAAGATASQMDAALRYPSAVGQSFASLARALEPVIDGRNDERHAMYELEIGSSMWGQQGAPFDADYLGRLKRGFAAELMTTDFHDPSAARARINEWTSKRTAGRVVEIIPDGILTADSRLVIVDTIRFKANWAEPFKTRGTSPAAFVLEDGASVEAPTLHRTARYGYTETELAQVLELPYEFHATSLVVVLPKKRGGLAEVVDREDFVRWTAGLEWREVEVALPKFRFSSGRDLKPALQALGMHDAFDAERADFSRILREPLFVGTVLHRALVAVDETGTEATAATAVLVPLGGSPGEAQPPVAFHADHPFLFFVRHRGTGAVLFVGRVANPTSD